MIIISIISLIIGFSTHYIYQRLRLGKFETLAAAIIQQAESQAHQTELALKEKEIAQTKEFEASIHNEKRKLIREEERVQQKGDRLEEQTALLEKKLAKLSSRETLAEEQLKLAKENLEKIAGLSTQEAKNELITKIQDEVRKEQAKFIKNHNEEAVRLADNNAARVIALAIQRMATSTTSEITACTVNLTNEEIKGRIIGREGRNIRTFEKITGTNLCMKINRTVFRNIFQYSAKEGFSQFFPTPFFQNCKPFQLIPFIRCSPSGTTCR